MTPQARPLFTAPQALPTFYLLLRRLILDALSPPLRRLILDARSPPLRRLILDALSPPLRRLILDALSPPPSFPFGGADIRCDGSRLTKPPPPDPLAAAPGDSPPVARGRILFLNQFVPPDPAPTARLLGEVAEELDRRGFTTVLVGDAVDYRGGKTLLGSRALREALSLLRLLFRTLTAPRADAIVVLTSPPMVPVIAALARIRHRRAKLIHWAMDLYPDVAVALGEVREGSLLHRLTAALMARVHQACDLVIVLDREMAARVGPGAKRIETAPPWPPEPTLFNPIESGGGGDKTMENPAFTWLYSGNLGRAHEWRTLLEAQARLEAEGLTVDLVFQGGGAGRAPAEAAAAVLGLRRCQWRDYASESGLISSLLDADALVITQRPETAGCLWPSKLALAVRVGRSVLWVGNRDGGVARWLEDQGHFACAPGDAEALAREIARLVAIPRPGSVSLTEISDRITQARREGIDRVAGWIAEQGCA